MCGIAGIVQTQSSSELGMVKTMLGCLVHRGPDDEGVWQDPSGLAVLGQRRLAIIDLSPGGHQPRLSDDGRFTITFNGEIYNYQSLRAELISLGHNFNSESDTEVLLKAFIQWGADCLLKLNGMFAFAVWDTHTQTLFMARDPLGEKPLKYYQADGRLWFASELKAIIADARVPREVDWSAVDLALSFRYVPAPQTGFLGIKKLSPGHYATWQSGKLTVVPYWQARDYAKLRTISSVSEEKAAIWDLFKDSVRLRLTSDVPLGVFLSGGLDSSSVVAAMAHVSDKKIKTFSVGFPGRPDSETPFARLVAERYGTDHTEIMVEPDVISVVPELVRHYEEPYFDNSAVPTMVMARLTKPHVTVVLTGDGGDECFGGYPNQSFFRWLTRYQHIPQAVRGTAVTGALGLLAQTGSSFWKKQWYRGEMMAKPLTQAYTDYYGIWQNSLPKTNFYITKNELYTPELKALVDSQNAARLMGDWLGIDRVPNNYGAANQAMLADMTSRLSEGYLMKVDYAAMHSAVETRPPFLDRRLVERALSLPEEYKLHQGDVKWILKQAVAPFLPAEIVQRRKMGFGIPIISWLKNELAQYVKERLLSAPPVFYTYFDRAAIERLITDHQAGKADYSNHIWSLLLLEMWLSEFFYEKT